MFKFLVKFGKIMMIACLIGVGLRVIEITTKKDYNIAQINQNETIAEEVNINDAETEMEDISVSNNIEEKVENREEKKTELQSTKSNNKLTNETKDKKVVIASKSKDEKTIEKIQKENTISNKVEEKIDAKIEEKQENKEVEKKEDIKQVVEEYKKNTDMIKRITEFIKENETEDMKNYGYEIVVDSSIVELTNQFTLTEQRIKNKIKLKYGTIKIYSQDYYYNGEYITTQCFIL